MRDTVRPITKPPHAFESSLSLNSDAKITALSDHDFKKYENCNVKFFFCWR